MSQLVLQYGSVCKLISSLFPRQIEVVLHDLTTNKIVLVEGDISNRVINDDSLIDLAELKMETAQSDLMGPFAQQNGDGERLRSFSAVLRNAKGARIGLLCVNCRTAAFSAAAELLSAFTLTNVIPQPESLFSRDWREITNNIVVETFSKNGLTIHTSKRSDKVEALRNLDHNGVLEMRGAVEYVAKLMGMSRASIYNLLRDARETELDA